jgi:hypothetical protein
MRFYSRIIRQPESVISEIKDGLKVVRRKRLCVFRDGVCDVDDPEVIAKLQEHPEKYRTDGPWPTNRWQDSKEGKDLLEKGRKLGINMPHIRKEYLISLIAEKEKEMNPGLSVETETKEPNYQEVVEHARALGIKTHQRKKEDILEDIKKKNIEEKEVVLNVKT